MTKEEHTATVRGFNLAISKKFSVEVANFIRRKKLKVAKELMEGVIEKKIAVPFRKHNRDLGHKRGIGPGRYPIKVAKQILILLESAEMNATNKGLDVDALFIKEISANKGSTSMKGGRHRGREAKRTHLEILLEEKEEKKKTKKAMKKSKKGEEKK